MNSEKKSSSDHNDESRRRPGQSTVVRVAPLAELARRIERTYLARLKMAQRLQIRGAYWNAALISLALASSVSAVALLVDSTLYGSQGALALALIGIFTLVASLTVGNADYAGKARQGFAVYRNLQRLSVRASASSKVNYLTSFGARRAYSTLDDRYQDLLDHSDNHSPADYARAVRARVRKPSDIDGAPTAVNEDIVSAIVVAGRWLQIVGSVVVTLFPLALAFGAYASLLPIVLLVAGGLDG